MGVDWGDYFGTEEPDEIAHILEDMCREVTCQNDSKDYRVTEQGNFTESALRLDGSGFGLELSDDEINSILTGK